MFDVRNVDLSLINSMTKYPSILTYHVLNNKNGCLLDEVRTFNSDIVATEKVDGTNSRIICLPDGNYLLGSREELLFAKGDLIGNPALGIVAALKGVADQLVANGPAINNGIRVYFGELFGGKITQHSKQYTGEKAVAFRLFDVLEISDVDTMLTIPRQEMSRLRDSGWNTVDGTGFVDEETLASLAKAANMDLTPRILAGEATVVPTDISEVLEFLKANMASTQCAIDDGAGGRPEGLVIRTNDRSQIAKLRFRDYEKTIRNQRK